MYRKLLVVVALMGVARSAAVAQTCMGLASYKSGPVQVAGHGQVVSGAHQVGASVGYGHPGGAFGDIGISTTSVTGADAALEFGASAGYQVQISQAQICPVAAVALSNGPDSDAFGINGSTRSARVGFALGAALGTNRMQVVPTGGLSLEYARQTAEDDFGNSATGSDAYGVGQLGLGLIFNSVSVRPGVAIPLGLTGADPVFELTVGVNFGGNR
jgi:hypothetical protein